MGSVSWPDVFSSALHVLWCLQEKKAKAREEDHEEDGDGGMDPDMMAMMGFGGFGSSKK